MSERGGDAGGRRLAQLDQIPVSELEKVDPKKVRALADWGVTSVLDLLTTYPRRYIDRTRAADVADLAIGDEAVVFAEVKRVKAIGNPRGRPRVEVSVSDATGALTLVFFNQPWREKQLTVGSQLLVWGKLAEYRNKRQMAHPVVDLVARVESGAAESRMLQVIPVYPASAKAGLTSWEIGTFVKEALSRAGELADPLPTEWRHRLRLHRRSQALHAIHRPERPEDPWPARDRLVFDELLRLQLILVLRRRAMERAANAIRHEVSTDELAPSDATRDPATLVERFVAALPFELTAAQCRALRQIFDDMAGPLPMHRLLQGDVGSGKTVVAVGAMLAAVQGGHQGALMAPTEVRADQHYLGVRSLARGLEVPDPGRLGGTRPVSVGLLTNRVPAKERTRIVDELAAGQLDIVIGTHALLTEDVRFHSLGAVVVDEQHRFGVEQRAGLRAKGRIEASGSGATVDPDLLVMTATPIPRTAAMVVFGDLDMTVVDELPAGRAPITTLWARGALEEAAAWERVRAEVRAGHRAYVICPLVEESERVVARSAVEEHGRLSAGVLKGLAVGMLHGQLPTAEKRAVMDRFRDGELQVLVATTVIEVGVDVPEATVVVIEDADRFGIAQLHQLRGRVGRSSLPSWCYLFGGGTSEGGETRLSALERTTDGFELAEVDLELRGEGTILGERQTGSSGLRLAKLRRDRKWVERAREVAESIVEEDPDLRAHPALLDEVRFTIDAEEAAFLFKS
ncbi:MAG: ATP-dependent DNA helicase RecG [Acidimicrobiales bacterium]